MFPFIRMKNYLGPYSCTLTGKEIKRSYTRSVAFFGIVDPFEAAFPFLFPLKTNENQSCLDL